MEKTVTIGGKAYRMRASALIPRLYRFKFQRDAIADMNQLKKAIDRASKAQGEAATDEDRLNAQLSVLDLTIFENMAWLMCKHADKTVPDSPDDWLDSIDGVFSVYEVLPHMLELWEMNNAQTSQAKKK